MNFMESLKGYKTYFVACATVAFGILGLVTGQLPQDVALVVILNGLGLGALRDGMPKS